MPHAGNGQTPLGSTLKPETKEPTSKTTHLPPDVTTSRGTPHMLLIQWIYPYGIAVTTLCNRGWRPSDKGRDAGLAKWMAFETAGQAISLYRHQLGIAGDRRVAGSLDTGPKSSRYLLPEAFAKVGGFYVETGAMFTKHQYRSRWVALVVKRDSIWVIAEQHDSTEMNRFLADFGRVYIPESPVVQIPLSGCGHLGAFQYIIRQHTFDQSCDTSSTEIVNWVRELGDHYESSVPYQICLDWEEARTAASGDHFGALFSPLNKDCSPDCLVNNVLHLNIKDNERVVMQMNKDVFVKGSAFSQTSEMFKNMWNNQNLFYHNSYVFMGWVVLLSRLDNIDESEGIVRMPSGTLSTYKDEKTADVISKYYKPVSIYKSTQANSTAVNIDTLFKRGLLERHPPGLLAPDEVIMQICRASMEDANPLNDSPQFRDPSAIYGELNLSGLKRCLAFAPQDCKGFIDVGSGFGNLLLYVACIQPDWEVVGVERDLGLVEGGKRFHVSVIRHCSQWGLRPPRYRNILRDVTDEGWFEELGLPDGKYLVWCNSLKWEGDPLGALRSYILTMTRHGSVAVTSGVVIKRDRKSDTCYLPPGSVNWKPSEVQIYVYK